MKWKKHHRNLVNYLIMMLKINDYKINIIKLICSIVLRTNVWYNI